MAAALYQNLSLTEPRLIPQLENVIMIFIKEIKQQNSEMENLALAIKRYPSTHLSVQPSTYPNTNGKINRKFDVWVDTHY